MALLVTWGNPQAVIDASMMLGAFRANIPAENIYHFFFGFLAMTPIWFGFLAGTMYPAEIFGSVPAHGTSGLCHWKS